MNILIITGELASKLVKDAASKSDHNVQVHVVKTPIAAFLTPKKIIGELRTLPPGKLESVEMIITPGLIRKDVSPIKDELGIKVSYIGLGEGIEDLKPFDIESYLYTLVGLS